ncbi:unnamed protein product [Urochloa humidicola]
MADWRVSSRLHVCFSWRRAWRRKQSAVRLVGALEEEHGPAAGMDCGRVQVAGVEEEQGPALQLVIVQLRCNRRRRASRSARRRSAPPHHLPAAGEGHARARPPASICASRW